MIFVSEEALLLQSSVEEVSVAAGAQAPTKFFLYWSVFGVWRLRIYLSRMNFLQEILTLPTFFPHGIFSNWRLVQGGDFQLAKFFS